MITRDDVFNCYKYILGRPPEDERVIEYYLSLNFAGLEDIRDVMLRSPEFFDGIKGKLNMECLLPPQVHTMNRVNSEASDSDLALLVARIKREWEDFGRTEPHWSVLIHEDFKQSNIEKNLDSFYGSGMQVRDLIGSFFARHASEIAKPSSAFELGCGVGRITAHLAPTVEQLVAADISKFHLDICAQELKSRGIDNVELLMLDSPFALKKLPEFALFYSFIVLQHNPPPVIAFLLDTILSKIIAGGVAIFQVPVWQRDYSFDLQDYLHNPKPLHMEMHVLPQNHIFKILRRNGFRLVEIREDSWAGLLPERLSNTFYAVKDLA